MNLNWSGFGIYGCVCGFSLIALVIFVVIANIVNKPAIDQINAKHDERIKRKIVIYENGGLLAPGIIISAIRVRSWGDTSKRRNHKFHLIDYEVDVFPPNDAPFHTKFREEIVREGYQIKDGQMVSEHGWKIWVTYDPSDKSKAFLDHFDTEHETAMETRDLDFRQMKYNLVFEENEKIERYGQQAEAVITQIDDLQLPASLLKSRAMHLHLDVNTGAGANHQAECDAMISEASLSKYTVGRKVFIRFNSQNPRRVALDTKRNKKLE